MESKEFEEFLFDFAGESDRAAVILGAAKLDVQLSEILTFVLVPSPTGRDELLDGDSPLSTFSAKINLAYRLGLIDAKLARSLHLIRKIRNSFAHETSTKSFASGAHCDRVRELLQPFVQDSRYPGIREIFAKRMSVTEDASIDFRAILGILVLRLSDPPKRLTSFPTDKAISLMPEFGGPAA